MSNREKRIKSLILQMTDERRHDKTICPSEVARKILDNDWRTLMPIVRDIADQLAADGQIIITQKGKRIDSAKEAIGPIRLSTKCPFG
ncbi:DUF3253 domain-containing protein [Tunicatimonas pelagia]|uniref:DUF3253 domain-containing protein n=1 Tax=Tunicatimonas pelagia TaxID=931531 RepID=UPI0026657248|nr:DUF3253 domain-containing protein [Tunicatimonas pelagia]WKN45386.1 DUF3253 domain-containing protein [Tunicatimonas pelagia]